MLHPTERPSPSTAPRLAASMIPGPPPVMIGSLLGQQPGRFHRRRIVRIVDRCAGRSEDRHGVLDIAQFFESFDEFPHDAEDSPGIGLSQRIGPFLELSAFQDLFVGGGAPRAIAMQQPGIERFTHGADTRAEPGGRRACCKSRARPGRDRAANPR